MKGTIDKLKAATTSTRVSGVTVGALLVPIAAIVGGINLGNHNETLLRDAG